MCPWQTAQIIYLIKSQQKLISRFLLASAFASVSV